MAVPVPISATERIRCARFRGPLGADPVGTAGHYDAFVVVESPLPWARDATMCWPFVDLGWTGPCHVGTDGRRWRPVVVAEPTAAGVHQPVSRTVTVWERPAEAIAPYRSRRWELSDPDDAVDLVRAIVGADTAPAADAVDGAPALHLCTHGRRDVCCGSLGSTLVESLVAADGPVGRMGTGAPVELWRCSHTGGHRFAPTGLTFPDGLAWAHLDERLVAELAARVVAERPQRPSADLVASCRGVSSLPEGPAQVADRAAWAHYGWGWVDSERRVEIDGSVPETTDDRPVTVRLDGALGAGTVQVAVARMVPTPTCGTEGPLVVEDTPTEREWVVVAESWDRSGPEADAAGQ